MVVPSAWANTSNELAGFDVTGPGGDLPDGLQSRPAVADASGENFGVVYLSEVPPPDPAAPEPGALAPGFYVRFRAYDHVLKPLNEVFPGPVTLNDGNGKVVGTTSPAVVSWGEGYAGVWQELNGAGQTVLRARATGPTGLLGEEFALGAPAASDPSLVQGNVSLSFFEEVRGADTVIGFIAAWTETFGGKSVVRMERFEATNDALGNPVSLVPSPGGPVLNGGAEVLGRDVSVSVLHDGETAVVWVEGSGQLRGQFFTTPLSAGTVNLNAALAGITVPAGQEAHVVGLGAGNFGVFWVDEGAAGGLALKGRTFLLLDAGGNDWVPQPVRTIIELPGNYAGTFSVVGLGEANDGGVVSFATSDNVIHAIGFDAGGQPTSQVAADVDPSLNASGGFGVATLVSDRFVVVGADGFDNIRAQMLDTRDTSTSPVLLGDRVRDANNDGIPERVDARPDLIVGTIVNDTIIADRGDARNGDSDTDTVFGGMGDDTLYGGGDSDVLDGGVGSDVAAYRGAREVYSVTVNGDGSFTVKDMRLGNRGRDPGPDGQDIIDGVEQMAFDSGIGTALGQGGVLTLPPAAQWVSTGSFFGGNNEVPVGYDAFGTPQPWGLEDTASFAVNPGDTAVEDLPVAVSMLDNYAFVWRAGEQVLIKAFNTLGQPDAAFGGAGGVLQVASGEAVPGMSGLSASMAGGLGVVATWQAPVDPANPGAGTAIYARHVSAVNGPTGAAPIQVSAPASGATQRDAAVVGYEIVDANNDTIEYGFNVVYTEVDATNVSHLYVNRFVIPFNPTTSVESPPVPTPLNGASGLRLQIAGDVRDVGAVSQHDGELVVTFVEGNMLKAAVLDAATTGGVTSFGFPDTFNIAELDSGATYEVASLTTSFVVAYTTTTLVGTVEVPAIEARIVAPLGGGWEVVATSAPFVLPEGFTGEFHIAPTAESDLGGGFALFWEVADAGLGTTTIFTQVFGPDAAPTGSTVPVFDTLTGLSEAGGFSAAGLTDGRLVVAAEGQLTTGGGAENGIIGQVLDTRTPGAQIIGPRDGAPADLLVGTAGNDVMDGRVAEDELHGGLGSDLLIGGSENDTLFGGAENDTLVGGSENDVLNGEDGDDLLLGGFGADVISGGAGSDTLSYQGEFASFTVALAAGTTVSNRDPLTGASGASGVEDTFTSIENARGGEGNDRLSGTAGANELIGNGGSDTLEGGGGNDSLLGGAGGDSLVGGDGDDTFDAGAGNDTVVGGAGTADTLTFAFVRAEYTVIVQNGVYTITHNSPEAGSDGVDTFSGIEFVSFSDRPSIPIGQLIAGNPPPTGTPGAPITGTARGETIQGTQNADTILGRGGPDVLLGLAGDDTLDGGAGADSLVGGTGNDLLFGRNGNDTLSGGQNNDRLEGGAGDDLLDGGAGADTLLGGDDNDRLIGDAGADSLSGGQGRDTIDGGDGNDTLDGGLGADSMIGGAGDDFYFVNSDGDVVVETAGAGNDTVRAAGSYVLGANLENLEFTPGSAGDFNGTGNGLANLITGTDGNNLLLGRGGRDTLFGNAGHDTLDGGAGADTMTGGTGDDLYIVDNLGDRVAEAVGTDQGLDTVQVSLTQPGVTFLLSGGLENLVLVGSVDLNGTGSDLDNGITGNDGANVLSGMEGNDTLDGGIGNDTLDGGIGGDAMAGGLGDDSYVVDSLGDTVSESAGQGVDTITTSIDLTLSAEVEKLVLAGGAVLGAGNGLDNAITGNGGDNLLQGLDGNDTLEGDNGKDTLEGGLGNDTLNGGDGDDTLDGGTGDDSMAGGTGDDLYRVDSATDAVSEAPGAGRDTVEASFSFSLAGAADVENLTLVGLAVAGTGNALNNLIIGNALANTLSGGDGNDTLDGGLGSDTLTGGLGDDLYRVNSATDVVSETGGEGVDTVEATASYSLAAPAAAGVENLTLLGSAVTGTGNALANLITGNDGANTLSGGDGNDTIIGGLGADLMGGGLGNDTFQVDDLGDRVNEAANGGIDLVISSVTFSVATTSVENITLVGSLAANATGNTLANALTGNEAANLILGGAGNDTVDGGAGADTLNGETGNDSLLGGEGADTVDGGAGNDTLDGGADNDVLNGAAGLDSLLGGAGSDTLDGGVGDDTLDGGVDNDVLNGGNGLDNLLGGDGDDTLDGGAGTDTLAGGVGRDVYLVNSAGDVVIELADGGSDTVVATVSYSLAGSANVEDLTLQGTAVTGTGNGLNNLITGSDAANTLSGQNGDDTLLGGLGNDTLVGGVGADQLAGGAGNDMFRYLLASEGGDTVTGFTSGQDHLQISRSGFGGGLTGGTLAANRFTSNASGEATAAVGQFIFETDTRALWWDANGTGAGGGVIIATFTDLSAMVASDIQLIG